MNLIYKSFSFENKFAIITLLHYYYLKEICKFILCQIQQLKKIKNIKVQFQKPSINHWCIYLRIIFIINLNTFFMN